MEAKILHGDITKLQADAIVNAADTSLRMGGGVAGAIKRAGGREIEDEAVSKGPIEVGGAVATTAGKLKAKYVIHAAAMSWETHRTATEESIRNSLRNSLAMADGLKCKSIALPAIGCGIAGFPLEKGKDIILDEIKKFKSKNLQKASLVLYR
ncbi:unnamed protein product [marine sediment metagenome]|uniref:Macro domain-containing protein n=1 Tax=marine sediment metagenome TaxID=412755 RepID=X0S2V2_9ZZZZ